MQPPAPKPASSRAAEFSAERAFEHVRQIAQKPHPLGSTANDSVRKYITGELQKLGLDPQIQEGIGVAGSFGAGLAGHVKNIFAQMPGRDPQKTILLMAHYDSAPNALGAADDASGVAAILESIRALKAQETQLRNNVWILITDGEERGLLGAEQFVASFPALDQIDLVLNFEARGTAGPSLMFETSSPNANLIPHFARATPYPVANSLMYTVYKLLPNDTDLSVTKQAGLKGLNFAFTKRYLNYHTMQDSPENLSPASLQHHGSNLLGNLRHFGNTDFNLNSNSEYVYFNSAAGGLTYYPAGWSFPLAAITALLLVAYLIYLFRTGRLGLGSYLGSLLLFIGMLLLGTALTYFGWQGLSRLHPEYRWLYHREVYPHQWYLWGFSALMLALFTGIYGWMQRRWLSVQQLLAGSITIWVLLSVGTAWYLPTASYVFTWPASTAVIGWIVLGDRIGISTWGSTALLAVSLFAALFIIPPYIYLVQIMLTTQMLAVSMLLLLLVLGLTWPLVWQIIENSVPVWAGGLAVISLACFIIASTQSGFDVRHKKQNDMSYIQDLDSGQAYWVSRDPAPDEWTIQFLGTEYHKGTPPNMPLFQNGSYLYQSAELNNITPPKFRLLADSSTADGRRVTLRVHPQEQAIAMRMDWNAKGSIRAIDIDGKRLFNRQQHPQTKIPNRVSFFKDLTEPTTLAVTLAKNSDLPAITFTFLRMGLPTQLIPNYSKRKPYMMPTAHWNSNTTLWQAAVDPDTLGRE